MIDQIEPDLIRLLDWLPTPAFAHDPDGTMRYGNAALVSLLGSAPQHVIFRGEEHPRLLAGEVVRSESTFRLSGDDHDFTILATKRAAKHPQWGDVIVGIGQDLSGGRSPEQDDAMAHLRHELQSPLSAIAGLASLLLESPLDDDQRNSLRLIHSTAESCLALLTDMVEASKPGRGEWSLRPTEFSLREFLDEVLRPFELRADSRRLRFSYSVAKDVPARVHSDALRLRQVLQNLVGNAFKYTEAGSVEVDVTVVDLEAGPDIRFSVRDTGIGVPEDQQSAIFLPFVQGHGSATRRYGGTGLGLSIASRIVTLLGGRIWVESKPLEGSVFSFVIPCDTTRRGDTGASPTGFGFDRESALELTGGDGELLKELAVLFLEEYPKLIANLRTAVMERDPKKLDSSSHALKGAVSNFGARAAVEAALWLESKGRAGDTHGIDDGLAALERILEPLLVELQALKDS